MMIVVIEIILRSTAAARHRERSALLPPSSSSGRIIVVVEIQRFESVRPISVGGIGLSRRLLLYGVIRYNIFNDEAKGSI